MTQIDVRQDAADYNRLVREWKESFQNADREPHNDQVDATSR